MANIAVVFHWAPSEMDAMSLAELSRWHAKALARGGAEDEDD